MEVHGNLPHLRFASGIQIRCPLNRRLDGPQNRYGYFEEEKILTSAVIPIPESPASCLAAVLNKVTDLQHC